MVENNIISFKQTDINMPSFIDVTSVIGISHVVENNNRQVKIYLTGGAVYNISYSDRGISTVRSICEDIIATKKQENSKPSNKKHR